MNEEEPEAPILGEQGALPSHLFNHRTLPTLPCCPWLPIHCPVLWGDGHLSTLPITQVHHVTQASLPWAWPPASLFHSLPHQPSWGPVPSHSVSHKYFQFHTNTFCLSSQLSLNSFTWHLRALLWPQALLCSLTCYFPRPCTPAKPNCSLNTPCTCLPRPSPQQALPPNLRLLIF